MTRSDLSADNDDDHHDPDPQVEPRCPVRGPTLRRAPVVVEVNMDNPSPIALSPPGTTHDESLSPVLVVPIDTRNSHRSLPRSSRPDHVGTVAV